VADGARAGGGVSAGEGDVAARLSELGVAGGFTAEGRRALVQHAAVSSLAPGEIAPAPDAGGVLVLLRGRIEVRRADDGRCIAGLAPGALVPALSVLEREVELVAGEPCEVARVPSSGIDALVRADPDNAARVAARSADGERSLQVAIHLSRLFPRLDRAGLDAFAAEVEWRALGGGEWLFRQGDPGDAAYLVVSGRLRAVTGAGEGERVRNEMGAGETIGEMALLSDDVRSASVHAVRGSQLVRLSRAAFDRLTEEHPEALRRIAGFVVDRLRHAERGLARAPLASIAVVGAHPDVGIGDFVRLLTRAIGTLGSVERIDRARVDAELGRAGSADARDDEAAGIRLSRWLSERDAASRFVIHQADPSFTPWSERALRQADHVLVVARASDGPAPGAVEARLPELWRSGRAPRTSLVLLHPPDARPRGTARWLAARAVDRHFHVREGRDDDVARLARLLTGKAVGLVLGGGGARGFAHLGALRALEEAGVPIDFVGGTSIGAIIAAGPALGLDAAEALDTCRRRFSGLFDVTLPLVSLLAGRRIGRNLEAVLGEADIEDLLLPYFCVATNLSRAQAVVHQRGPLFRAVRSSISLPGVLPPVTIDGDVYVDGGLLDNLPIEVMASLCGGPVVAIDVSPEEDLRSELDLLGAISGWQVLWHHINPFARRLDVPWISSVLMRSVVVASLVRERERQASELAGLYIKMPVDDWGLLEFSAVEAIAAQGYRACAGRVLEWWSERAQVE
jgi:predicted acylesterase/phospholipase RssA/CRP-like cAMP-binding protein